MNKTAMDNLDIYGNPILGQAVGGGILDLTGGTGDDDYDSLFGDGVSDVGSLFGDDIDDGDSLFGEVTGNADSSSHSTEDLNNSSMGITLPTSQGRNGLSDASKNTTTAIKLYLLHLPTTPDPLDASVAQKDGHTSGQHVVCTLPRTDTPLVESEAAREAAKKEELCQEKEDKELEAMWEEQLLQEQIGRQTVDPGSDHDRRPQEGSATTDATVTNTPPSDTTSPDTPPTPFDCQFGLHILPMNRGSLGHQPVKTGIGQGSRHHKGPDMANTVHLPPEHSTAHVPLEHSFAQGILDGTSGVGPSITSEGIITLADIKGCASPYAATRKNVKLDRQIHDDEEKVNLIAPYITFSRDTKDSVQREHLELSHKRGNALAKEVRAHLARPENAYLLNDLPNAGTPSGKLMLLKSAFRLLTAGGWGTEYFGRHGRDGEEPRKRCWPGDSTAIIFNVTQFLYKQLYLEKVRLGKLKKLGFEKLGMAAHLSAQMGMGNGSMQYPVSMDSGPRQSPMDMGSPSMQTPSWIGSSQSSISTDSGSSQFLISTEGGSKQFPIDLCNDNDTFPAPPGVQPSFTPASHLAQPSKFEAPNVPAMHPLPPSSAASASAGIPYRPNPSGTNMRHHRSVSDPTSADSPYKASRRRNAEEAGLDPEPNHDFDNIARDICDLKRRHLSPYTVPATANLTYRVSCKDRLSGKALRADSIYSHADEAMLWHPFDRLHRQFSRYSMPIIIKVNGKPINNQDEWDAAILYVWKTVGIANFVDVEIIVM